QFGFDIASTVTFQLQVTVPGHAGQGSMKERVGIVPETWHTWVLNSGQAAAWSRSSIHGKNPQPTARHVRLQDQRVVSRSENDAVILIGHRSRLRAPRSNLHTRRLESFTFRRQPFGLTTSLFCACGHRVFDGYA